MPYPYDCDYKCCCGHVCDYRPAGYDYRPVVPLTRSWHCYLFVEGSTRIYTANVDAATAEEAAVLAAGKTSRGGAWTVIPGSPVKLLVNSATTYTAARV